MISLSSRLLEKRFKKYEDQRKGEYKPWLKNTKLEYQMHKDHLGEFDLIAKFYESLKMEEQANIQETNNLNPSIVEDCELEGHDRTLPIPEIEGDHSSDDGTNFIKILEVKDNTIEEMKSNSMMRVSDGNGVESENAELINLGSPFNLQRVKKSYKKPRG